MPQEENSVLIRQICHSITEYLMRAQDFTAGEYYGSFWSEKAYHGPLLDYHAGGAHHHRGCGSAALAFWLTGRKNGDQTLMRRAEQAFDWLVARQHQRGGWFEIQNKENPANWENTGMDELSTIATAFVVHGLGHAMLNGLPPKKSYRDCLMKAGLWLLSIEWPAGSGVFPHHERSPYDTINADAHAVESLAVIAAVLRDVYRQNVNIFQQGARRGTRHILTVQWQNGCIPYRAGGGVTINYTALVLWCLGNAADCQPERFRQDPGLGLAETKELDRYMQNACAFLRQTINPDGSLQWEDCESSTAKYNIWTVFITLNVLSRIGGPLNQEAAGRLLRFIESRLTPSGLPPMRDRGEEITECAFMQADILLFLLPLLTPPEGALPETSPGVSHTP